MNQPRPTDEAQLRAYIEAGMARLKRPNDPAWQPFEEFMTCLPLDQQYGVVRFAMHRGIAPSSQTWIIFALTHQLWLRAADAIGATLTDVKREAARIEGASKALNGDLATLARETKAGKDALAFSKAELDEAVKSALSVHGVAFRRDAFNLKAWSIFTVVGALVLAIVTFLIGTSGGFKEGYSDGTRYVSGATREAKRDQLKNMLSDPAARRSPAVRVYLDGRLRSL